MIIERTSLDGDYCLPQGRWWPEMFAVSMRGHVTVQFKDGQGPGP